MISALASATYAGVANHFRGMIASTHPCFYIYIPYWTLVATLLFLSPLTVVLKQLLKRQLSWPLEKDVPNEWTINGKRYDLRPFFKDHPGGQHVLRTSKGSDCTGLFESCHLFIDRDTQYQMLKKFEIHDGIEAEKPSIDYHDEFYADLKQVARAHFRGKGKRAHKMTTSHLCLNFAAWVTFWFLNWTMVTKNAFWCIPFVGCLAWYLTGNVMHDATHSALVVSPWLNRLVSRAAFPYGLNVAGWRIQHVMSHHIYTNEEADVDLYHYDPIMSLEKGVGVTNSFLHGLRLFYLLSTTVVHLCLVVPYLLLTGHVDPAHGHAMYDQMKKIDYLRSILRGELAIEVGLQFSYFYFIYKMQGFVTALCFFMSVMAVHGYCFAFFTQVSHLQQECFLGKKKLEELSFAKRQVVASMDFAADSFWWGHISGGLNTQAIHHVFPSVSAMHLREMYPQFRVVCKKHGVQLKEARSLGSFVWGFISYANT
jgi:fatty acid desaturase